MSSLTRQWAADWALIARVNAKRRGHSEVAAHLPVDLTPRGVMTLERVYGTPPQAPVAEGPPLEFDPPSAEPAPKSPQLPDAAYRKAFKVIPGSTVAAYERRAVFLQAWLSEIERAHYKAMRPPGYVAILLTRVKAARVWLYEAITRKKRGQL